MSQMRKDIFTGRWVIMAETSTVRPSDFDFTKFVRGTGFCPFCETNEASTQPEVFAIRNPGSSPNGVGWSVRVVPNSDPRLRIEGKWGMGITGSLRQTELKGALVAHCSVADSQNSRCPL
jgi:UDPglucose--hexose-1-phosphate uridylyltransferase